MTVRTRFAPSPTGYLHIGGVRTALFNYLFAKKHGGQFLLRIDDTDQTRNVDAALQPILDGFRWLGLHWDEGPEVGGPHAPYFQSQRLSRYQEAVDALLASGAAYRDFATADELAQQRSDAEGSGKPFLYDRSFMGDSPEKIAQFESQGRASVVRLKMPREGNCDFHDLIRGDCSFAWAQEQDHVIQRADGSFIYHLANVVDDYDFQITHVIRAVEHLPNTPRQIFIAQALNYPLPAFAHLPYVAEPGGTAKLSKRKLDKYLKQKDFAALNQLGATIAEKANIQATPETFNPVVVDFYREIGFLPESLLNYLLLLGWSLDDSTEHFSLSDAIEHFSLERVNKSPASFDPQKLVAFQTRWMNDLDIEKKAAMVLPYVQKAGWVTDQNQSMDLAQIAKAAGDRIKVAGDILQFDELYSADDQFAIDEPFLEKKLKSDRAVQDAVEAFCEKILQATDTTQEAFEPVLKGFAEEKGIKLGNFMAGLRIALTGKSSGLTIFDYLSLFGKERSVNRIRRVLRMCSEV